MTQNLDIDLDTISTIPIDKLSVLRADALAALAASDAIGDWFSPEGIAAYKEAIVACAAANAEMERLAKNPKTRHGSWRTPFDIELMLLGFI